MNKSEIVVALVKHYCNGNKARFAEKIGVTPQTLSKWIARDSYDLEKLYAGCEGVNAAWLITGEGEMMLRPANETAKAVANGNNSRATAATNSVLTMGDGGEQTSLLRDICEEKERLIREKDARIAELSSHLEEKERIIRLYESRSE